MKLIPARKMFQPGEGKGSMKPDMWITVINLLVHWTLADTQVSKHLDLVFITIKISVYKYRIPSSPGSVISIKRILSFSGCCNDTILSV